MMFIVRSAGGKPDAIGVEIKVVRKTPPIVPNAAGKLDFFCVGEAAAIASLRAEGWEVVELRDGWYEDDSGGGIVISGQGKYWEVRDTPFTVKEAVGPMAETASAGNGEGEVVNVRRAVFGV
jgi:hypothetical protein